MGAYINGTLTGGESVGAEAKLHWVIFLSLGAILTLFIGPLIKMMSTEYAVTNKRLIWKSGLISRSTGELNLKKIESVNVDQGILGRLLGYGTVVVSGTGGSKERFAAIADPAGFRMRVQESMDEIGA